MFCYYVFAGTVSVTYLVCFAMRNAISWGVNMEFTDTSSSLYVHGELYIHTIQ